MARLSALGLPNPPRASDYPPTVEGGMRFTQDSLDWITRFVEATDDHRKAGFETTLDDMQEKVYEHEAALRPIDARNPGWIAVMMQGIRDTHDRFVQQDAEDKQALLEESREVRAGLKWGRNLAFTSLVAVALWFAQQLYVRL